MKRCSRCVFPQYSPNIVFDEDGVCNQCHSHWKTRYRGEAELLEIIDSHHHPASNYDCLVAVSGGRDSAYALLKLAKDCKKRVLAVNYENPFADPQAKLNIENMIRALNIDLFSYKLKNNIHERTFRNNVITWFKRPSPAFINLICVACKTIDWELLRIAKKHKIRCIIGGTNAFEDTSFKKELLSGESSDTMARTVVKAIYPFFKEAARNPGYLNPLSLLMMVKSFFSVTMGNAVLNPLGPTINRLSLFEFIKWDEKEILSRIKSELNWDYPERLKSSWRFDCRVAHLKDYMFLNTIGMTERDDLYSKMVRDGILSREEAIRRLERENIIHSDEIRALLDEVGIDHSRLLKNL